MHSLQEIHTNTYCILILFTSLLPPLSHFIIKYFKHTEFKTLKRFLNHKSNTALSIKRLHLGKKDKRYAEHFNNVHSKGEGKTVGCMCRVRAGKPGSASLGHWHQGQMIVEG